MFVKISILALALSYTFVAGDVDESSPDLSRYNLRKVNPEIYAHGRANVDTVDSISAALNLHDAISSNSYYVKCSAYAHLFRMMRGERSIRQDAIDALAIVASEDRIFYKQLLDRDALDKSTDNFSHALSRLGQTTTKQGMDVIMELVKCARDYMHADDESVNPTLFNVLKRTGFIVYFDAFYKKNPGQAQHDQFIEENEQLPVWNDANMSSLDAARRLVAQFDNGDIAALRATAKTHPVLHLDTELNDEDARHYTILLDRGAKALPIREESEPESNDESEESQKQRGEIELLVPENGPEDRPVENEFTESQLLVLRLVKMRISSFGLHKDADGKNPPVPISSLIDFDGNWKLLQKATLNPNTKFGAEALEFRTQKTNIDIARRVEKSISTYSKMAKIFGGILESQKSSRSGNLAVAFWSLETYLNEIDPVVDVSNIRRAVDEYKNKGRKKEFGIKFWRN